MVDIDFSFIRFRRTKEEAFNLGESPAVTLQYEGQVHLKPFDLQPYLQLTNISEGLSIEDYTLWIVDCYGNEFNATNSLHIAPFIDSDNKQQFAFELIHIDKDFGGELVYFRIDQLNAESWYSNRLLITEHDIEYTSRIDFRHNERYFQTDYPVLNFYQGIRLNFYYNNFVNQTENTAYYAISTNQNFSLRANIKHYNQYIAEQFNGWASKRLNLALNADTCYIDTVRNEPVETAEFSNRELDSNLVEATFLTDPIETDIRQPGFQIYEGFIPLNFDPAKNSVISQRISQNLTTATITFNQNVTLEPNFSGSISGPNGTNIFLNNTNVSVNGADLIIDITGVLVDFGIYSITINANGVKGGRYGELWRGVNDYFITIRDGDFQPNDFNNDDFLT